MRNKLMIFVLGAMLMCMLPATADAQQQEEQWRSTSVMMTSGSNYAPQLQEVGATSAFQQATTTESTSSPKVRGGIKRIEGGGGHGNPGEGGTDSPIGDAVLPLMLMAMSFCGTVYLRRQKALKQ